MPEILPWVFHGDEHLIEVPRVTQATFGRA
jgi:hypothetical protein